MGEREFSSLRATITYVRKDMESKEKSDIYRIHPTPDPNSPTGIFIPSNIEEAIAELEKALHPQLIEEILGMDKSQLIGSFHFGLGTWMRNNWGLWKSNQLTDSLRS